MTKRQSGLSALTRHLLGVFTYVDMVDSIVEDMEDRYAGNVEQKGCVYARSVWIGKLAIVFLEDDQAEKLSEAHHQDHKKKSENNRCFCLLLPSEL